MQPPPLPAPPRGRPTRGFLPVFSRRVVTCVPHQPAPTPTHTHTHTRHITHTHPHPSEAFACVIIRLQRPSLTAPTAFGTAFNRGANKKKPIMTHTAVGERNATSDGYFTKGFDRIYAVSVHCVYPLCGCAVSVCAMSVHVCVRARVRVCACV
jgi:hypothetical protein